jgi:hypothetical protein
VRSIVLPDLRASDLDRERAVEFLKRNYAEGRLSRAELTARVDAAYRALGLSQLDALTADLPAAVRARARRRPGLTLVLMAVVLVGFLSVVPIEAWLPLALFGGAMLMMLGILAAPILVPVALIAWVVHRLSRPSPPRRGWR